MQSEQLQAIEIEQLQIKLNFAEAKIDKLKKEMGSTASANIDLK